MTQNYFVNRRYPPEHPLIRGRGSETNHLGYWHLEQQTIFPVASSPGLATGPYFQFRAIAGGWLCRE